MITTHEVTNQPPPRVDFDPLAGDRPLFEGLLREGAAAAIPSVGEFGRALSTSKAQLWATQANENPPRLRTHDRYGDRLDEVEFHPSWHELMRLSYSHGLHCSPWREPRVGAHVARAARMYLASETESGHGCPISMTYSAYPALQANPALLAQWGPLITSLDYDERALPSSDKRGALIGMAMTEKQGGSDVRANTTRATALGAGDFSITGHKWFCSAPMSDAFLVLAQAQAGLSCFLLPRYTPEGKRNAFRLQRLKDKLGNRSNASSEIEFDDAFATLIGEEGRGVPTILEMVNHTRLDCVIGAAGLMRRALAEALHHAQHRMAFGKRLAEHALMRAVLADLAIESEAATALMLRLARAYDRRQAGDESETAFARLATACAKFWICKRAAPMVAEALECLGGNGYVEESGLPRLYREAPLNSIWEGSGNVICLDVLRALAKEPRSLQALLAELEAARGADRRLDAHLDNLGKDLADPTPAEPRARRLVESLALALQGSLLVRFSTPAVADAFCATRLGGDWGHSFGTLPTSVDPVTILTRAQAQ